MSRARPSLVGRPRAAESGRSWRIKAYRGSASHPGDRIRFKHPDSGRWVDRSPEPGETLEDAFARYEQICDGIESPTIQTLCAMWLEAIEADIEPGTYDNRTSMINVWIVPYIGAVDVHGWTCDHSRIVIRKASQFVGPARVEDVRTVVAQLRSFAWASGYLSRDVDPMDGVKLPNSGEQGLDRRYVEEALRPTTEMVAGMVRLAIAVHAQAERQIDPLQIALAAYLGPRLAEQLGLGSADVDLRRRTVRVRGVWDSPNRRQAYYRPWPKNRKSRNVPYPASMEPMLLDRIRVALGVDPTTTKEALAELIDELNEAVERWHRLPPGRQEETAMPDKYFLFLDPKTGIPWEQEAYNERWRALVSRTHHPAAPAWLIPWPKSVKYRNLRHHAAMWWRNNTDANENEEWTLIARWLGNDPETCRRNYVKESSGAEARAMAQLAKL